MRSTNQKSRAPIEVIDRALWQDHLASFLPSTIVDRILVGRAGRHQVPPERPLVVVVEALTRVRGRRRIEDAGKLEVLELDRTTRLREQIVGILPGILVDGLGGTSFGAKHFGECRSIELIASSFAAS